MGRTKNISGAKKNQILFLINNSQRIFAKQSVAPPIPFSIIFCCRGTFFWQFLFLLWEIGASESALVAFKRLTVATENPHEIALCRCEMLNFIKEKQYLIFSWNIFSMTHIAQFLQKYVFFIIYKFTLQNIDGYFIHFFINVAKKKLISTQHKIKRQKPPKTKILVPPMNFV